MQIKQLKKISGIGMVFFLLTGCGSYKSYHSADSNNTITIDNATVLNVATDTTSDFIKQAEYIFERLNYIWDNDGGELWGVPLHAPTIFANPITRKAVANVPDKEGKILVRQGNVYIGYLPDDVFVMNSTVYFGGQAWGMLTWDFVNGQDLESTLLTLVHKTFHVKQLDIFEGYQWFWQNIHVDDLETRINVRLELAALLIALNSTGNERLSAVQDALAFRTERRKMHEGVYLEENFLEILEGTAVFNDTMLMADNLHDRISMINVFMERDFFGQTMSGFGYYTGAMYALLLDEFGVEWRSGLTWDADLAAILADALELDVSLSIEQIDLQKYDYDLIRLEEQAWVIQRAIDVQKAREAMSGPLLFIYALGEFNYFDDAAEIVSLDVPAFGFYNYNQFDYGLEDVFMLDFESRTVFWGNFIYTMPQGQITFDNGYLALWSAMWRHGIPAIYLEVDRNKVTGQGWVLILNDGFEIVEIPGGHFRIAETGL